MADDSPRDQHDTCVRAIGAAIADSADLSGEAGSLMRRTLTDFATFANRMEEEAAGSTQAQLKKILKTIDNFSLALAGARSSLEGHIQSASDADELVTNKNSSKAGKEEKPSSSKVKEDKPFSSKVKEEKQSSSKMRKSRTLTSAVDEALKARPSDSTEWIVDAEEHALKFSREHRRVYESRLLEMGLTQSGVEIAQMSQEEFDSLLKEKQFSPENSRIARDARNGLRKRYRKVHSNQVKKMLKSNPVVKKQQAGTHLRVDYEGLLASVGLQHSFEQIGKMSLADFNAVLSAMDLDAGQTSLAKMVRARAKTRFNSGGRRTREQTPMKQMKGAEMMKKKKTRGGTAVISGPFEEAFHAMFNTPAQIRAPKREFPVPFHRERSMGPTSQGLLNRFAKTTSSSKRVVPSGPAFGTVSSGASAGAKAGYKKSPIDLSYTPLPSLPASMRTFPTAPPMNTSTFPTPSSKSTFSMPSTFTQAELAFDAMLRAEMPGLGPLEPFTDIKQEEDEDIQWV